MNDTTVHRTEDGIYIMVGPATYGDGYVALAQLEPIDTTLGNRAWLGTADPAWFDFGLTAGGVTDHLLAEVRADLAREDTDDA